MAFNTTICVLRGRSRCRELGFSILGTLERTKKSSYQGKGRGEKAQPRRKSAYTRWVFFTREENNYFFDTWHAGEDKEKLISREKKRRKGPT